MKNKTAPSRCRQPDEYSVAALIELSNIREKIHLFQALHSSITPRMLHIDFPIYSNSLCDDEISCRNKLTKWQKKVATTKILINARPVVKSLDFQLSLFKEKFQNGLCSVRIVEYALH